MLLMTRKAGDRIAIDDRIVVTVVEVQGNRVQLGIEAPREIAVREAPAAATPPDKTPK